MSGPHKSEGPVAAGPIAKQNQGSSSIVAEARDKLKAIGAFLSRRLWVLRLRCELAREGHAAHRRYLRSALCCVGLAVLRVIGGAA